MSEEEEEGAIERMETIEFHGVQYDVMVTVDEDVLTVEVESCKTFDQWCGKYDAPYIEELTHKTGNFKQFNIFCNMFESALTQNTESVTLDLLTYDDLKILREQKLGHGLKKRKHKLDTKLNSKRYLIMTYSVEFDQIHYPLPLNYQGTSDPATLKLQLRHLKSENQKLRKSAFQGSDIAGIENDYEKLLKENKELKTELLHCQQNLQNFSGGGHMSKELKVLKKVIQNLEVDLLKERSKHQRMMNKKFQEYNQLIEEFEDIKANERNLKVRCKNLTSELSILKKNSRLSPCVGASNKTRNKSTNNKTFRNNTRNITPNTTRGRPIERSNSRTRGNIHNSRERSISASSLGRRTPSPGYKRFDPSAYVKEKERKLRESSFDRSRKRTPSSLSTTKNRTPSYNHFNKPPSGGGSRTRRPYQNSNYKRRPSVGSDTDSVSRLKTTSSGNKSRTSRRSKDRMTHSDYSDDEKYGRTASRKLNHKKASQYKPSVNDGGRMETDDEGGHSLGIAEIDARLEALQKFMKDNID